MNLLKETLEYFDCYRFLESNITFIGSIDGKYKCSWEEFLDLANFEYHDGYGGQEVASDLIIVFKDGIKMYRHEYDGSECWNHQVIPKEYKRHKKIKRLKIVDTGWDR